MEEARQSVEAHLARANRNDTTVHEKVAPAVTRETITRTEHEEVTTAVDQEIHQDHYHVSVQPITEEEYREEQHHHTLLDVEQENFEHDDPAEVQSVLAEVAAQFRNEVKNVTAEKTTATLPDIEGVHIHHHVFETIQPVITKQTFEPHVYHVVRQRHQIHHNRAIHHAPSTLPALTLAEFLKNGGVLNGREERYDAFEGEPRSVGKALSGNSSSPTTAGDSNAASAPEAAALPKTAGTPAEATPAKPSQFDRVNTLKGAATGPVPTPDNSAAAPPPTRVATRAGLTREPTAFGSLDRVLSNASIQRAPTPGLQRAPTAPLERVPTVRFERAPTAISRAPTAPLDRAPTAALERVPTDLPAATPTPTGLATRSPPPVTPPEPSPQSVSEAVSQLERELPPRQTASPEPALAPPVRFGAAGAMNHPLLNPSTTLPQHAYRDGHGTGPARHRRRPEAGARQQSAPVTQEAPEQSGTLTDKPTEES